MNKEWSELNKTLQLQLKKESSFKAGINTLFELRDELMKVHHGLSITGVKKILLD